MRNFYNKFVQSCINLNFFKHIVSDSNIESFKFIFIVILFISVIVGFRQGWLISEVTRDVLDWSKNNLPPLSIKNGILTTQAEQPYFTAYKDFPVFLDTTGEIKNLETEESGILIKKDKVLYKIGGMNTAVLKLDKVGKFEFNLQSIKQMKKNLAIKIIPLIVLFMYIYFCIVKFTHIFLFSFLGMVVNRFKNKGLNYKEVLNISIYAFSPVALLSIIFGLAGLQNTISWLVYNIVYAFYVVSAIFYISPVAQVVTD